jgi:poly(A) polymerase
MNNNKILNPNLDKNVEELLRQLQRVLADVPDNIWLVGGTIRDLLEELPPTDFDFAFSGDLTPHIKRWAGQQGGRWFWLDKKRNQSRVLFTTEGLQFDFSPLRAEDIEADLRLRDFTLNAMALTFSNFTEKRYLLVDPLNGRRDLEQGILRSCGPSVLNDDPLRVLKGVRHYALRGWRFDRQTASMMTQAAPLLASVAGERLRNELGQILGSQLIVSSVELLERFAVLDQLFPGIIRQGMAEELDLLTARIAQLAQLPRFATLLDQSIEEGLTRRVILLLAALMRRVESLSLVEEISQRLRLSTRSRSIVQALYGAQISLGSFNDTDSSRVAALKLEALGRNCLEMLLFALASHKTENQDLQLASYFQAYQRQLEKGRIKDLLDGGEIIALTGLPPGQEVGDWQKRIKAAEIAGEISNRQSAGNWLGQQFSD